MRVIAVEMLSDFHRQDAYRDCAGPTKAWHALGIGFSHAIGLPEKEPGLKNPPAGPAEDRSTQVWADLARNLGDWRLGAGELAGL